MTQVNTLTIDDIVNELDAGRATVKFILKRFSQWLPFDRIDGDQRYSQDILPLLMQIRDWLDNGVLPSRIEALLEADKGNTPEAGNPPAARERDIRMSKDALGFIQELFTDIKHHQNRIARAHEKRAEAEERKAIAIEKRAEAEEKKADAMNNIASALQEMNRQRAADIGDRSMGTAEIAAQAAQALTMSDAEPDGFGTEASDRPDDLDIKDLESLFDSGETNEPPPVELEDIAGDDLDDVSLPMDLLDEAPEDPEVEALDAPSLTGDPESESDLPLDDLSSLIDTVSDTIPNDDDYAGDNLEALLADEPELPELDDLFADGDGEQMGRSSNGDLDDLNSLLDDTADTQEPAVSLDDLYALVDAGSAPSEQNLTEENLDNLSLLVDAPLTPVADLDDLSRLVDAPVPDADDMDDLSLLVTPHASEPVPAPADMDDLSLLVQGAGPTGAEQETGDDLWSLVEKSPSQSAIPQTADMDDLSALVGPAGDAPAPETPAPSLKPDITPEENLGAYKAAVMKIIIELKSQGLTAGDTTDRLNADKVATLSGKPQWREKAIAKIYGFIDSAK